MLRKVWRALGLSGLWLRQQLVAAAKAGWAFLGRLGLALRKILGIVFWRPAVAVAHLVAELLRMLAREMWAFIGRLGLALRHLLTMTLWRPLAAVARLIVQMILAVWAFIGRLGLALREMLSVLIWQPLLYVTAPLRWFYRKTLRRPVRFVKLSLRTVGEWVLLDFFAPRVKPMQEMVVSGLSDRIGKPARNGWRQLRSRRLVIRWQKVDSAEAIGNSGRLESYPPRARLNRVATAAVTTGVILILGLISGQTRNGSDVVAMGDPVEELKPVTRTPTPRPSSTATAAPTNTPVPTVEPPTPTVVAAEPWPTPDPLGKGGSVAFSLDKQGNSDLYALTLGRSEPVRLTSDPAEDRDPAWSPNGQQLAFASNRGDNWDIYVLDLQTGGLRRLTQDPAFDGSPSWSPDGKWLVYESYREGNLDLYIIAADGNSLPIRVTEHESQDFSPTWSPDGRHIAFTSWRGGNSDIFIMSLDSASDEGAINVTLSPDMHEDHPALAPDGHYLSYFADGGGFQLVYVQPLEGYRPAGAASSVGQGRHPSWSPDGTTLVYVHNNETQSYVVATSVDAWNIAPQAYTSQGRMDDLAWSAVVLPSGTATRLASNEANVEEPLFIEQLSPPTDYGASYLLQQVEVEAPAPYLNDRVDDSFSALRARVNALVGWDFLGRVDNMFAFLTSRPLPGESNKGWSKAGRAFDFYYRYPISIDPQVEIVREDRGTQTYWRVYLRAAVQDGSQGEPLRQLPWDFEARYDSDPQYYDQGGKAKDEIPAGYYVDFTSLAADYGWTRVPALENWRTYFQGIRYWHFESRQGLTWEDAILELYTPDELAGVFGNS